MERAVKLAANEGGPLHRREHAHVLHLLVRTELVLGFQREPRLVIGALGSKEVSAKRLSQLEQLAPAVVGWNHKYVDAAAVKALHEGGVTILAGSDSPNRGTATGVSIHQELAMLVQAGLTPAEALAAATSAPADAFGLMDRGRIRPGR